MARGPGDFSLMPTRKNKQKGKSAQWYKEHKYDNRTARVWVQKINEKLYQYGYKICTGCGYVFELDEYVRSSKGIGGRASKCNACIRPQKRQIQQVRRVKKYKLPFERFDDREIFERDYWICQLCGEPVNKSLDGNHPDGPTVDHYIPLGRGGHHTRENTGLSHRHCNAEKHTMTLEEWDDREVA